MYNSVKTVHVSLHIISLLQLDSAHNIQVKALLLEFQQQTNWLHPASIHYVFHLDTVHLEGDMQYVAFK